MILEVILPTEKAEIALHDVIPVDTSERRVWISINGEALEARHGYRTHHLEDKDQRFSFWVTAPSSLIIPRKISSLSSGSSALYPLKGSFPLYGRRYRNVLGQFLPAGQSTSPHWHELTIERFIPILGNVELRNPTTQTGQLLAAEQTIYPRQPHQLFAHDDSFTLIVMDGPYHLDDMSDHYYCGPSSRCLVKA